MAREFIDGWESGDSDLWDTRSNDLTISSAGLDMDGDYCLSLINSVSYVEKNVTDNDEGYFAFLWRPQSPSDHQPIILFYSGSAYLSALFRNSTTNNLDIYRGTTVIASGTKNIVNDVTYLVEVRFKIADAGGRFVVKVDDVTDIDFTGDTQESTYTQFNRVRLGYYASTYFAAAYYDNFRMDNAGWIGTSRIQAKIPSGVGNSTNWTPSAGANWQCIDERPASDVDYNKINSNNITDTYLTDNLTGSINSIKCVQGQSRTRTEGTPTPTNLKLVTRRSGTDYLSGDKAISATYKSLFNIWETDPSTSVAWTESGVNAAESGIRSAA